MNTKYDVLIVGGGIVGLTAALAMSRRDCSVAVVDVTDFDVKGENSPARVYAINQASRKLFEKLNVWEQIEKAPISPYSKMYVWDEASKAHIEFDSRAIHSDRLGSIIDESSIKSALLSAVSHKNITLLPKHQVTAVTGDDDGMIVTTSSSVLQTQLLMVADGANSTTRELLRVPITSWPYHQNSIVATVRTELPHQHTAFQVFNPEGPLAFLPLANTNECSIVWSLPPGKAAWLMNVDEEAFNLHLKEAFAAKLGTCKLLSPRRQFPLTMRHTQQYVGKNWMLLGDAAHTIHPLAGLGLNLGLADVDSWLAILDRKNARIANKYALGAYQRQRKHAVWQVVWLMEGIKSLFANPFSPIAALRGFGLKACNSIPLLKRMFISHAAGDL